MGENPAKAKNGWLGIFWATPGKSRASKAKPKAWLGAGFPQTPTCGLMTLCGEPPPNNAQILTITLTPSGLGEGKSIYIEIL